MCAKCSLTHLLFEAGKDVDGEGVAHASDDREDGHHKNGHHLLAVTHVLWRRGCAHQHGLTGSGQFGQRVVHGCHGADEADDVVVAVDDGGGEVDDDDDDEGVVVVILVCFVLFIF